MAPKRKYTQQTLNFAENKKGKNLEVDESDVLHKYGLQWDQSGDEILPGMKSLLYLHSGEGSQLKGSRKVAGFDIDSTIITTKSGKTFATNIADWKWLYDCIPTKLRELHDDGFRLVFFTNQMGLEKKKVTLIEVQTKIQNILNKLDLPIFVFAATAMCHYRKPCTEMWTYLVESCNQGIIVNLDDCIYVGDAAGRAKGWAPKRKKDFSCADRKFAANIGIKFYTPEEFFLKEKPAAFEWSSIDAKSMMENVSTTPSQYHSSKQELVIMVGLPAAGKSTFCKRTFEPHGYVIVNRDTLNTQAKCIQVAEESLGAGKSVVIDNTNPSKKDRAFYIGLAKKKGIPARCFRMTTDERIAHHLNIVRQNVTKGKIRRIPHVVYNVFKKNLEKPTKSEGFSEVVEIEFRPDMVDEEFKKYFVQWTE